MESLLYIILYSPCPLPSKILKKTIIALGADVLGNFKANEASLEMTTTGFQDSANFTKALNDEQILIRQWLAAASCRGPASSSIRQEREIQDLRTKMSALETIPLYKQGSIHHRLPFNAQVEITGPKF